MPAKYLKRIAFGDLFVVAPLSIDIPVKLSTLSYVHF